VQKEEGPIPTYLEENNEYAFAYSMTQYAKNEEMDARIAEIKDIVKTFELITVEPLSYSITGVTATVSKETIAFNYSADQLEAMADECGTKHSDPNYFEFLVSQFKNTTKTIYNFKYTGASQQSDTFIVSLLPNKCGYSSIEQFKKDFDICSAGGSEYPKMLNNNWLVFINSCGTGFDDGSGKPHGCDEIKEKIEPTLKLNKEIKTSQITQETEKTFEGSGFSFIYPTKYTADSKGLWTEEGYKNHINPPKTCDTCQIPEIEVKATTSNNTIDQQIINDYSLPGTTLAEMSKQTGVKYENVKIGDNDFIKITVSDMLDVTGYYTKHNNQIVAFRVYWTERDTEALKEIISTLKFQ
ncbi:MAG: hypothetical protein WC755_09810, partial [Candidatus Woesearchaeota archaeon]